MTNIVQMSHKKDEEVMSKLRIKSFHRRTRLEAKQSKTNCALDVGEIHT